MRFRRSLELRRDTAAVVAGSWQDFLGESRVTVRLGEFLDCGLRGAVAKDGSRSRPVGSSAVLAA